MYNRRFILVLSIKQTLGLGYTRRTAGLRPAFCSLLSLPNRVGYKVWQTLIKGRLGLVLGVTGLGIRCDRVGYKVWQGWVQGVTGLGPSGSVRVPKIDWANFAWRTIVRLVIHANSFRKGISERLLLWLQALEMPVVRLGNFCLNRI